MMKAILLIVIASTVGIHNANAHNDGDADMKWRAGVARVVITPAGSMWMAGYASRNRPSEGTIHDLWAKALALEDVMGNKLVLISTDLVGIPKSVSDRIRNRLKENYALSKAQIVLNSSHTHTGPALHDPVREYQLPADQIEKVISYSKDLEDKIVALVGDALGSMESAQLYVENGVTRFQVNRRNNREAVLSLQTELNGPNDYAVPVIKVVNQAEKVIAIAFGYACHATVLSGYQWSGDYVGFAQLALERKYPGATALFFQGAGADQNPLPRRSVALAQQYGETLAAAVERVIDEEMRQLPSQLSVAYSEVELSFSTPPSREELLKISTAERSSSTEKRWATGLLEKLNRGESLMTSYPYPVQVLNLGNQLIFALGGETVIEYAIELKRIFGSEIFVFGYSNDSNVAYIPSATILREGGYEGATSQLGKGLPGPWASNIETVILSEVMKLTEQLGIRITSGSESEN